MQISRDAGALVDPLFKAKLQHAARDGPAKQRGDQNSGDRRCGHDNKNTTLNIFHVRDADWQIFVEVPVETFYVARNRIPNPA